MGLFKKFVNQTRKPEGFLGKMMLKGMNKGHVPLADWGMRYLEGIEAKRIAELGCGGGKNADTLLKKYPSATLTAIDYSPLSVEKARELNRASIEAGRCVVQEGDVSALTLEPEAYDLATAFETIYFWPGLEKCFSEVAKILKSGGTFMIVNEADGADPVGLKYEKIIEGMTCHTAETIEKTLRASGFREVRTERHASKPWITVMAKK